MTKIIKRTWKIALDSFTLILSFVVFLVLTWTLYCKLISDVNFSSLLIEMRDNILTISGLLSGLIIAYLTSKVIQIRQEKIARLSDFNKETQKLHKCRSIIDKLVHSQLWPQEVRYFVDNKYKGLTYFDVREIVFVDSNPIKRATDFIRDENYSDIAKLYLELKSFKFDEYPFDNTLHTEFDVPLYYSSEIIQKWIDFDCGDGLYYYFDYKYAVYKNSLKLHDVYSEYKNEIKETCLKIDQERYKDIVFGPELLSKLGSQLTGEILPKLIRIQKHMISGLPIIIKYLFSVAGLLIIFGVIFPLINKIYGISSLVDLFSVSVVLSTSFYLLISFYGFMIKEIKI